MSTRHSWHISEGDVSIHAKIKVRITKDIGEKRVSQIIDCTVGRLIFNENIPQNLGYVDRTRFQASVRSGNRILGRQEAAGSDYRSLH